MTVTKAINKTVSRAEITEQRDAVENDLIEISDVMQFTHT